MSKKPHISEAKKKLVKIVVDKLKKSSIVGIANLQGLPAPQLQKMKALLRDKVDMVMVKKTLTKISLDQVAKDKAGLEGLNQYLKGNPAVVFTNENPFTLYKTIKKNKSPAPAKPGQTAPKDIIINAGPTPFAPGPVISELKTLGLQTSIENGKIVIKSDAVVCKEGQTISEQLASMLTRLKIEPMEIGLDMVAVYENGLIYNRSVLDIDEEEFMKKLSKAISSATNLSVEAVYPTKQNISLLVGKASRIAKGVAVSEGILAKGVVENILAKAHSQMLALKNKINFNGG